MFTDQLGPEYTGKKAIIAKALYGLRSSGRSFRDFLAMNLRELGFISSKADPDLWLRSAKKPNGDHIYEYVFSYVDDLVFQGINPKVFMDALGKRFSLKPGSIKEPDTYLGANVKKFRIPNSDDPDKVRWAFESRARVGRGRYEAHAKREDTIGKWLSAGARPFTRVREQTVELLPRVNRDLAMDLRAREDRYPDASVHTVSIFGICTTGTPRAGLPYICIHEDTLAFDNGF